MFGWIAPGVAAENDWRLFLPVHLEPLGLFLLLTWASGGYLGLAMGAALVGWMSYFVGSFAVARGHPVLAAVAAWVPSSVLRGFAFLLLWAPFATPLLLQKPWPFCRQEVRLMALPAAR